MTREVDFDALRQQTLAAVLAAAGEDGTPVSRLHAGAETELLFARALGCLIGTFHSLTGKMVKKSGKVSRWGGGVKTGGGRGEIMNYEG